VSRAVSGKWMQTPRGMVELRRFFSGGLRTDDGGEASFEAVRQMLKDVVEAEDRSAPLSDEAIAQRLKERGVSIARRTVVKYREQLGIPSARHRKSHG
jgi:RNA polymerase sigma-54 factor